MCGGLSLINRREVYLRTDFLKNSLRSSTRAADVNEPLALDSLMVARVLLGQKQ